MLDKTDQPEVGCWVYEGTPSQYHPVVWDSDRANNVSAHVAVYELLVGPVPEGKELHHECETRGCVRPNHLRLVGHGEHTAMHKAKQTHCRNGHEFSPENTYVKTNPTTGSSQRVCRACSRAANAKWRAAKGA